MVNQPYTSSDLDVFLLWFIRFWSLKICLLTHQNSECPELQYYKWVCHFSKWQTEVIVGNSVQEGCLSSVLFHKNTVLWGFLLDNHIYGIEISFLSDFFGPNLCRIQRWYAKFIKTGSVCDKRPTVRTSRWPFFKKRSSILEENFISSFLT